MLFFHLSSPNLTKPHQLSTKLLPIAPDLIKPNSTISNLTQPHKLHQPHKPHSSSSDLSQPNLNSPSLLLTHLNLSKLSQPFAEFSSISQLKIPQRQVGRNYGREGEQEEGEEEVRNVQTNNLYCTLTRGFCKSFWPQPIKIK